MANYDAEIRVGTKINIDALQKAQKEFDKLDKKLEALYAKGEKLEALGVDKQSKQWKSLRYDVAQAEIAVEDAKDRLKEVSQLSDGGIKKGFDAAEKSAKKFNSTVQGGTKKTHGLLGTLLSRLKGIALSLLIFNWITKGFNAMVSAMKEGFQNLTKYSSDYNRSMSDMRSECAQLKNGLAAAFEPVANIAIPYITQLISWMNIATDKVAQFLAAISGKSTYTKAKKQTIDYAKALDTASSSAKRALASFDQLNVLNKNDSGSAAGELAGAAAFEEGKIGDRYKNAADKVLEAIKPFKDAIKNWWSDIDFEPLLDSFNRLKEACSPFVGYIYDGMLWFLENILLPFGSFVIKDAVPAFFDLLAVALEFLSIIIDEAKPGLNWLWENVLKPFGAWVADSAIDGINLLTNALRGLSEWCKADKANVELMKAVLFGLFAGIVTYHTGKKVPILIESMKTALGAFVTTIKGGISPITLAAIALGVLAAGIIYLASNWNKLDGAQRAITILGALAAAATAAAIAVAVFHTAWSVGIAAAAIVGGLALLGLTAAALKSNGKVQGNSNPSFANNDFNGSPLPMLADGAVIPGGRPFAAILGDQRPGQTNIEAPLDTIKRAVAEVVGPGMGDCTFVAQIDGREIFRETVKQDKMYQRTTGQSAFAY